MIDPVILNARKPSKDEYGLAMLNRMNERHQPLYRWGLEHVSMENARQVLDIGFGGGQNIKNMSRMLPEAQFFGIDCSEASCKKCAELNREEIESGRLKIAVGSADDLPYGKDSFDLVTAFETVYYWSNIDRCFSSICEALKEGGAFLVCNEDCSRDGFEEVADALNMEFYTTTDLEKRLLRAGFQAVRTDTRGNWVCAVGIK